MDELANVIPFSCGEDGFQEQQGEAVSSSIDVPIFHDSVYYGHSPTNPRPEFNFSGPIKEMTPQEKTRTRERFAKNSRDAIKGKEDNILKNFDRPRDKWHRAMIITEAREDEFLAEEITSLQKARPRLSDLRPFQVLLYTPR